MHTEQEQFEYMVSRGMRIQSAKVYAFLNNRDGIDCIPCAKIEYASKRHHSWTMPDLTAYYQECRNKARSPNYTFVGD